MYVVSAPSPAPESSELASEANQPMWEPLCIGVPIGRVISRYGLLPPTWLLLYIDLYRHHTEQFGGAATVVGHRFRMRGPLTELVVQVRVTPGRLAPEVFEKLNDFGAPAGPWPLDRFRPAHGINVPDLERLAELSRLYDSNMHGQTSPGGDLRAVLIPRSDEQEIRHIAGRLAGNTEAASDDTR
jgi:hypothetical protein